MAAVAVPQHIPTSRVAQAASAARTHLTLTHFSLQLLLSFLHSARLTLVLSIVNEHTNFEVRAGSAEGCQLNRLEMPLAYCMHCHRFVSCCLVAQLSQSRLITCC